MSTGNELIALQWSPALQPWRGRGQRGVGGRRLQPWLQVAFRVLQVPTGTPRPGSFTSSRGQGDSGTLWRRLLAVPAMPPLPLSGALCRHGPGGAAGSGGLGGPPPPPPPQARAAGLQLELDSEVTFGVCRPSLPGPALLLVAGVKGTRGCEALTRRAGHAALGALQPGGVRRVTVVAEPGGRRPCEVVVRCGCASQRIALVLEAPEADYRLVPVAGMRNTDPLVAAPPSGEACLVSL